MAALVVRDRGFGRLGPGRRASKSWMPKGVHAGDHCHSAAA